jgi:hypothetical protein
LESLEISVSCTPEKEVFEKEEEWIKYEGDEYEIYLPSGWLCYTDIDIAISDLKGAYLEPFTEVLERERHLLRFWGYDVDSMVEGNWIVGLMIKNEFSEKSFKDFIEFQYIEEEEYQKQWWTLDILEQEIISIGDYEEIGKLIISLESNEYIEGRIIKYIIKNNQDYWILTFNTSYQKYEQYREIFDEVVKTFKIRG